MHPPLTTAAILQRSVSELPKCLGRKPVSKPKIYTQHEKETTKMWQPQISLQSPFLRSEVHSSSALSSRIVPQISQAHINGANTLLENTGQKESNQFPKWILLDKVFNITNTQNNHSSPYK